MSNAIWSERPIEQARLLNPAFLATIVWSCAAEYRKSDDQGIPYPLIFIAVPIILHKSTRECLPKSIRTSLSVWLGNNPQVHLRFAERASSLVPLIKEGILFGANGRLLEVSSSRVLTAKRPRSMTGFLNQASDEVNDCVEKAKFVGKWLASSGEYTTIMALWGVKP
jgi:hypothetical protein